MPSHPRHIGVPGASAHAKADSIARARGREISGRSTVSRILRRVTGPSEAERRSRHAEHRWALGAAGEEMLANEIARHCPQIAVLHDLRIPGSRANIDHLAVTPTGVHVIDTKCYQGRITVSGGMLRPERLVIAGRDQTKLIGGLQWQVGLVERAVTAAGFDEIRVHGCLCFMPPEGLLADAELPLFRTLRVRGFPLYHTRRLCKQLNRPGPLADDRADALAELLAARFRPGQA